VRLMDPAVVADIQFIEKSEELLEMYSTMNLHLADLIILPVNNNQDPTSIDGGTHWALLVYLKNAGWYYFDSNAGESRMIINVATIVQNMKFVMRQKGSNALDDTLNNTLNESLKIEYVDDVPLQENTWDCGIYVISYAEAIVERYLMKDGNLTDLKEESPIMFSHITPEFIREKRRDVMDLPIYMIRNHKDQLHEPVQGSHENPEVLEVFGEKRLHEEEKKADNGE